MFLEICIQIHSVVYLHQVDKLTSKKYAKTINLLCAVYNNISNSRGGFKPNQPTLAYALVDCAGICVRIILLIVYLSESVKV